MRSHPPAPFAYKVVVTILLVPTLLLTRRHWRGRDNIPSQGGFVAAVNHISNLDFLAAVHLLTIWAGPPKVLVKDSLMRLPLLGAILKAMGLIEVKRGTAQAGASLTQAAKALQAGECVMIYPEGTLTHDPDLWPMRGRPGAVRLALQTGAPLVPIAQWGAHRILPPRSRLPRLWPPKPVNFIVGQPLDLSDFATWEDQAAAATEGTKRLMATITAMEAELRGESPPDEPYNQFAEDPK
ncbi:MAG: 1-acyl-sn-glycerol-3-phosphate acyltransferase [Micrococcales bacterium]|nr:1-acyl-sn-glycerol-3-phosphate acyltransferase [Micrococcales bacterium]